MVDPQTLELVLSGGGYSFCFLAPTHTPVFLGPLSFPRYCPFWGPFMASKASSDLTLN